MRQKRVLLLIACGLLISGCGRTFFERQDADSTSSDTTNKTEIAASCSISSDASGGQILDCPDGSQLSIPAQKSSSDCQIDLDTNGNGNGNGIITCLDSRETQIQNSVEITILDPCGPSEVGLDEVLIKIGNTIIAYYEDQTTNHLSLLEPGTYITTDTQKCKFTLTKEGQLTYSDNQ